MTKNLGFLVPWAENLMVAALCLLCALLFLRALHNLFIVQKHNARAIVTEEDHYRIGYDLYSTGKLAAFGYPSLFRAPGFPVFTALSLHARDLIKAAVTRLHLMISPAAFEDTYFVALAQLLVLLVGGLCFYRIARGWLSGIPAALFMLAYLVNPWTFTAVRTLNYYVLEYVFVTVLLGLCLWLTKKDLITWIDMVLLGLFCGVVCLIRPIYLTSPILIFAVLKGLKHIDLKRSLLLPSIFALTMLGAILPYSIRNWAVSGRFILISNQGSWALWANAVTPLYGLGRMPNWASDIWDPYGAEIFKRTTGLSAYSLAGHYQYSGDLANVFGREFIKELTAQPLVYAGNSVNNFLQYILYPPRRFETKFWFALRDKYALKARPLRTIFSSYYAVVTILAEVLLVWQAYRKVPVAQLALLLLVYLAASYSFTFLDERYMHGRIPVVLFSVAIIPGLAVNSFKGAPSWLPAACNYAVSGVSALMVSAPVIYLALVGISL